MTRSVTKVYSTTDASGSFAELLSGYEAVRWTALYTEGSAGAPS